jgi:hypothetical protein
MHLLLHVLNGGISSFGEHIYISPLQFLRASANHFAYSMTSVQHLEQSYCTSISISEEISVVCNTKSTVTVSSLPNGELDKILKDSQSMHSCKVAISMAAKTVCRSEPGPVSTQVNNVGRSRKLLYASSHALQIQD